MRGEFATGLASQVAALVVHNLRDAGLVHDERPLLSAKQAAARLGIEERTFRDLIVPGPNGEAPAIASLMVGGSRKVEPAELDRYVEQQKRLAWEKDAA